MQHYCQRFVCGWTWKRKFMKSIELGGSRDLPLIMSFFFFFFSFVMKRSTFSWCTYIKSLRVGTGKCINRLKSTVLPHAAWQQGGSGRDLRWKYREDQKTHVLSMCTLARKLVIDSECHLCCLLCLCVLQWGIQRGKVPS